MAAGGWIGRDRHALRCGPDPYLGRIRILHCGRVPHRRGPDDHRADVVGVAQFRRSGKRKYRNQPVFWEGIRFDSKLEMSRYKQLRLLERAGKISDLETQARIPLHVDGQKIGHYVADFRYMMG